MFFFAVLFIGLILLILWIILSLILTSNMVYYTKKKIPTLIAFPLSAFLILFIASFFTFGWGWFVPYALQPSYHEFKQMCELDPEIYQAKGGKLDEEYYNKVLAYFDTSLEKLDWDYIQKNLFLNGSGEYVYDFRKNYDRINFNFFIVFKDKRATRDNIKRVWTYIDWRDLRPRLAGNEGTGFYLSGDRIICDELYCEYKNGVKKCKY